MQIGVSDKRIKVLLSTPRGKPVKGLQPAVAYTIRVRFGVLAAADNLKEVADNHPSYRVHRWKGINTRWSVDVTANTRLLFDYDPKTKEISNMIYDDPH